MSRIAFLVPYLSVFDLCKKLLDSYKEFDFYYIDFDKRDDIADMLREKNYEIVVSRGGTAEHLRIVLSGVAVVELRGSGFDLVKAVDKARQFGSRIGVTAFHSMARGIGNLEAVFNVSLRQYPIDRRGLNIAEVLQQAQADGMQVIIGGSGSFSAAQRFGFPAVFIESSEESILQAAEEAMRIMQAIDNEKLKGSLFSAVLDNVRDGIIAIDDERKVTLINRKAQEMLKLSPERSIGMSLSRLLPAVNIDRSMQKGKRDSDSVLKIANTQMLCSKAPIMVNDEYRGGLLTFQEISRIQKVEAQVRNELYNKGHVAPKRFDDIVGQSPAIERAVRLAGDYAKTSSSILITGESGTGKEVFAQSIHNASSRKNGPFVAVNCAALPTQILESELFGYVGGAFTGANREGKIGLFELAHGGTIFLDEIAEMDYVNQSRLLRVLQERKVMRLGSDRVIAVDVRVISATNKALHELVREKQFRDDLFYRLNVLNLELPALRTRREDIPLLLNFFIARQSANSRITLAPSAISILRKHSWPGNVRELQNIVERLMASCCDRTIQAQDVLSVLDTGSGSITHDKEDEPVADKLLDALREAGGKHGKAAKILKISRTTLWRRMKQAGLSA